MTVHVPGEQFGGRYGIVFSGKWHGWIVKQNLEKEQWVAQYKTRWLSPRSPTNSVGADMIIRDWLWKFRAASLVIIGAMTSNIVVTLRGLSPRYK